MQNSLKYAIGLLLIAVTFFTAGCVATGRYNRGYYGRGYGSQRYERDWHRHDRHDRHDRDRDHDRDGYYGYRR